MLVSQKRTLKSRQIGLVATYHSINGTTAVDTGEDQFYVQSVVKVGTGVVKITFKDQSLRNVRVAGLVSLTASRTLAAIAHDLVSVTIESRDNAGAVADANFVITAIHATTVAALY